MNKEKFDYYWKVTLIVLLAFGMAFMFWQISQINERGIACQSQPFIWGAQQMTDRPDVDHFSCFCSVTGEDYFSKYSFNENQENPDP
jgi:hypothetical protein